MREPECGEAIKLKKKKKKKKNIWWVERVSSDRALAVVEFGSQGHLFVAPTE